MLTMLIAAVLLAPDAAVAPEDAQIDQAAQLLHDGKAADALPMLDAAITVYEKRYTTEKRQIYCSHSQAEAFLYMGLAAKDKRGAIAIGPRWCDALFFRGYALVDLQRIADGRASLEKAITMAPFYAHYKNELAYNYQATREWAKALELYQSAYGATALGDPDDRMLEQGRALRGEGYVLVEQGKWDDAKASYEAALKLDPNDQKAKGELDYIVEHRPR